MPSNVIHLNVELEAREHRRKLTPKQEFIEITERIKIHEEKLVKLNFN